MKRNDEANSLVTLMPLKSMKQQAVVNSLDVARHFGKRHDNIMQRIAGIIEASEEAYEKDKSLDLTAISNAFHECGYTTDNNRYEKCYLMNRDGFSLLIMGMTGARALAWKWRYIEAFNNMEMLLREKASAEWLVARRVGKLQHREETDVISRLMDYARAQGSEHFDKLPMVYAKLANHSCGIDDRDSATIRQLNLLALVENVITIAIERGMNNGEHYKQIYKNARAAVIKFMNSAELPVMINIH